MDKLRKLALDNGIKLSDIGFGCWAIGGEFFLGDKYDGWGDIDDRESIMAIRKGFDLGVNLFDTADVYGTGHSERILGEALKPFRHKVCIATKFGYTYNESTKHITGELVTPDYIEYALKESLKRLQTDYIDLYQLHVGSIDEGSIAPMAEKLESLVAKGLIRGYGWSTWDEKSASILSEYPNAVAIQHSMNLFEGNRNLLGICEASGMASLNNSPLAMGLLTGKYTKDTKITGTDVRNSGFEWVKYFKDGVPEQAFLDKLASIREIITADGRSLVQGALGYLMGISDNNIPIPGFKNVTQATENANTLTFGTLKQSQIEEIHNILNTESLI